MLNTEGVKILMIHVLQRAIQDYRANKRAIKRLTTKYDLSVDLEESIEIYSKIERLKGENNAIERFILNKESLPYSYIDTDAGYIIRLFREELSDDDRK